MVKVSEMIGDFAHPAGDCGRDVDTDVAMNMANDMRAIMNADREENLIAAAAFLYDSQCDNEEMIAAWGFLNARERRAWKEWARMGKC